MLYNACTNMEIIIGAEMDSSSRLTGIHPIRFSDGVPVWFSDGVFFISSVFALIGDIVPKIKNARKEQFTPRFGDTEGGTLASHTLTIP